MMTRAKWIDGLHQTFNKRRSLFTQKLIKVHNTFLELPLGIKTAIEIIQVLSEVLGASHVIGNESFFQLIDLINNLLFGPYQHFRHSRIRPLKHILQ
jgi:hypothetical protein